MHKFDLMYFLINFQATKLKIKSEMVYETNLRDLYSLHLHRQSKYHITIKCREKYRQATLCGCYCALSCIYASARLSEMHYLFLLNSQPTHRPYVVISRCVKRYYTQQIVPPTMWIKINSHLYHSSTQRNMVE